MTWIYLSPHFDDVALSCGGLVWEQAQAGEEVSIWTVCAGEPPAGVLSPFAQALHERWEAGLNAPAARNAEDMNSCQRLGAGFRHLGVLDCIYRRHPFTGEFMYASEEALNGLLHPGDELTIRDLQEEYRHLISGEITLVCPLALGNHVDHQLTRMAAEAVGHKCLYYADFPYVLRNSTQVEKSPGDGWECLIFPISDDGLAAWQDSIGAHGSQISTFWPDEAEMRRVVGQYLRETGGIRLWSRDGS